MFHLITNMFCVCTGRCTYFYRNQLASNALFNLFYDIWVVAFPSFTDWKVSYLGNTLANVYLILFMDGIFLLTCALLIVNSIQIYSLAKQLSANEVYESAT